PHQLFKHPKIVELAALAGVALDAFPEAGPVSGEAPLTPIQHWFFEQRLEEPQHYNQAFLFQVMERLDRACLEDALKELARAHEALRLRYARAAEGWRQRYSAPEESAPLTWMNLAQLPEAEQRLAVETASASAQASLNL